MFQSYQGGQCTNPCFSGVLLTSTPHNILYNPLADFPHNHCQNNGQWWEKNESCGNDCHESSERILAEPGIEQVTSCSEVCNPMGLGCRKRRNHWFFIVFSKDFPEGVKVCHCVVNLSVIYMLQDDMAGIGRGCPHQNRGQSSCINGGRIDASCCVDSHISLNLACRQQPAITGVLCCKQSGRFVTSAFCFFVHCFQDYFNFTLVESAPIHAFLQILLQVLCTVYFLRQTLAAFLYHRWVNYGWILFQWQSPILGEILCKHAIQTSNLLVLSLMNCWLTHRTWHDLCNNLRCNFSYQGSVFTSIS